MHINVKHPVHPADQITRIVGWIYSRGMTTTSGGNVSVMDDNGDIWITPSMVDKGNLQSSDIVCLKNDGSVVGKHKPSSEYPFHQAIYAIRPDIKAVIHAHPPALVSFSILRKTPDTKAIYKAWEVCGSVGYSTYEAPGSVQLGEKIAAEFQKGHNAIIMENHGTVAGAADLDSCYACFETLEHCARTLLNGNMIGTPQFLSDEIFQKYREFNNRTFPGDSYTENTVLLRNEMCGIIARACRHGLMNSTIGTVSVRTSGNDFLISPKHINRWNILPDDIVHIHNGTLESGKIPDPSAWLHQEIFSSHPDVNSIIQTIAPNIMAFGITHIAINVRTIPESWIYLQDIPVLPFESLFAPQRICEVISDHTPVVLIQHDSLLVTGKQLLQVYDRLEVAEFSAMSLVMAKPAGDFTPITDEQVVELKRIFFKDPI